MSVNSFKKLLCTDYIDTSNDNIVRMQLFKIICINKNKIQVTIIYYLLN